MTRKELEALLKEKTECERVYFAPPEGQRLIYPCSIIERKDIYSLSADNRAYLSRPYFQVTWVYYDASDEHVMNILDVPRANFANHYRDKEKCYDVINIYI